MPFSLNLWTGEVVATDREEELRALRALPAALRLADRTSGGGAGTAAAAAVSGSASLLLSSAGAGETEAPFRDRADAISSRL